MQLFAIGAGLEQKTVLSRAIVEAFLRQQLTAVSVLEYISLFDYHLQLARGGDDAEKLRKKASHSAVKVLRICTEINKELSSKQKYIVLIRLIEFILSSGEEMTEAEKEFLETVAGVFNIAHEEYSLCFSFVKSKNSVSAID